MNTFNLNQFGVEELSTAEMIQVQGGTGTTAPSHGCNVCDSGSNSSSSKGFLGIGLNLNLDLSLDFASNNRYSSSSGSSSC